MYELASMEWLMIAMIYTAGIYGCVASSSKETGAVRAAPAVRNIKPKEQ